MNVRINLVILDIRVEEQKSGESLTEKEKVVVIIGPTAVGKTELSIKLAKKLNAEIISGDSMQIYRGMDIGTAKITEEEMDGVVHHLIDIKNPDESFSVAEFQKLVREKMRDITSRGKLPMIVGGTGLYIQAALYDYEFTKEKANSTVRTRLEERLELEGAEVLHSELQKVDPLSAERIHMNNTRRVIRALEVYETTGTLFSEHVDEEKHELLYNAVFIGLTMEREQLYARINKRVDMMMGKGLLKEVSDLIQRGINKEAQSVQAIGYKELYDFAEGRTSLDEAVELLKRNSRRYAKRQLTWFRNRLPIQWFDMTDARPSEKFAEIFAYIEGK